MGQYYISSLSPTLQFQFDVDNVELIALRVEKVP